ncbi:hypothetical protein TSH7_01210 [Azospirillum sp. TSH7]|nr:hypothetical protein TSH7_01210 [Azospirillum sp. TSH7]PWC71415.1 hypothetical protein TSH20_03865 [Azospirillum sp. TSH20]
MGHVPAATLVSRPFGPVTHLLLEPVMTPLGTAVEALNTKSNTGSMPAISLGCLMRLVPTAVLAAATAMAACCVAVVAAVVAVVAAGTAAAAAVTALFATAMVSPIIGSMFVRNPPLRMSLAVSPASE